MSVAISWANKMQMAKCDAVMVGFSHMCAKKLHMQIAWDHVTRTTPSYFD